MSEQLSNLVTHKFDDFNLLRHAYRLKKDVNAFADQGRTIEVDENYFNLKKSELRGKCLNLIVELELHRSEGDKNNLNGEIVRSLISICGYILAYEARIKFGSNLQVVTETITWTFFLLTVINIAHFIYNCLGLPEIKKNFYLNYVTRQSQELRKKIEGLNHQ